MSVAKATCGGKTAANDASVQERPDRRTGRDWKPLREAAARGPARSAGIARDESKLLPARYAAHHVAGRKRQPRHPRASGDLASLDTLRLCNQRHWVPASAGTTNDGISARQIGGSVDVARDAGVVRLDELQLPFVRADNRFRALVA